MHAVLTARRVVAVVLLVAAALMLHAARAGADYETVAGDLQQWVWMRSEPGVPVSAAAVRDDGWLVVATNQRYDPARDRLVGGGLLLVAPWGGTPVPFGEPPTPGSRTYGFTSLVVRGDRLFGLTSLPGANHRVGQKATLVELDARSGSVRAEHGTWWFPDLAVDPQTNDLVLWTFRCAGRCDGQEYEEQEAGVVSHELVRYDPDTRRTTQVILPDARTGGGGGSGTCPARRGSMHVCEEAFRIAFSRDGNSLFLGTAHGETNAIDVRDRRGVLRRSIEVPRPVDDMVFGAPSTCFEGSLVLTSFDGSTWVVPDAVASSSQSAPAQAIASGAPNGAGTAALTDDGNIVTTRRSEAVLVACPGWRVPRPPTPDGHTEIAAPPATTPGGPAETAAAASAPPSAAPPAATNAPPPVQTPAPPAVAGPASHATQAVTSANVGLADAEEEQPVYGLSASRRETYGPAHARLLVGAAAVIGFAAVALATVPSTRRFRSELAVQQRAEPARKASRPLRW